MAAQGRQIPAQGLRTVALRDSLMPAEAIASAGPAAGARRRISSGWMISLGGPLFLSSWEDDDEGRLVRGRV